MLNQLTSPAKAVLENMRNVEAVIAKATGAVDQSGKVVGVAVEAMKECDRPPGEILRITDVIKCISFQANPLALNTGLEVARAGDAGYCFAVVASKVRTLAQNSLNAALEIKSLISNGSSQAT
ncbi:methyl-accepting chemotaxis protein [Alisedimentitalea sp. MJ-SS2]|uniref:methyl-accepting chemotaxis protein n=1 Tax=Aliisedimentitalea sp. MJ-SS2 TaxID=3049795 RepID=UPI00290E62CE|nr:methyl-accepting chemotaxis protein [Alisedimentitalea sp. MJ-SS2]MDU8929975.1 methyl-accepting chemotaxis protein [Alisedimentitalea sp. MJ-SS2]